MVLHRMCKYLMNLLCNAAHGNPQVFKELAYHRTGEGAIRHLYHVGTGLDSQILGDYEIIGQIKARPNLRKRRAA